MKFGTWVLAMVQPLIAKVLVSLGFSVVTITGLTGIVNTLKSEAINGLGLISPETLNLFLIAGGAQGLGIIFGACATKLMLWQLENATRIMSATPT